VPVLVDLTTQLEANIDALVDVDVAVLSDSESIEALHRQLDRLEAVVSRATARFSADSGHRPDGAYSAATWLATRRHLPMSSARRRVRLGRALRHMGVVEDAWLAGDIGSAQVGAFEAVHTPKLAEIFARDEKQLVGYATDLGYRAFTQALSYWAQLADPDEADDRARAEYESRHFHASQTLYSSWRLDGKLDPIGGAIFAGELGRIEDEMFAADWAEARERVGEGVTTLDLARTYPQRRADALVEMARRSAAMPAGARMPEPLFTVLVGWETFRDRICQLANGTVVTPGSLVPWLDTAWVERIVFDTPSRVMDVGVKRRLFTGATRRAVEVRDQQCFHEYCEIPAEHCEIDHVEPWAAGGLTTEANGRVACDFHNRQRHRRP